MNLLHNRNFWFVSLGFTIGSLVSLQQAKQAGAGLIPGVGQQLSDTEKLLLILGAASVWGIRKDA